MKAEHRHELETNDLAAGAKALVQKVKTGQVVPPKVLAGVLAVALIGGAWYYFAKSSRSAAATSWARFADLVRTGGPTDLEEFAKINGTDTPGRLARLELARAKLGADGIAKLAVKDVEQRSKAVASIEAARGELTTLADEFKGDKTLQTSCLLDAAEAELSLVGIAKTPGGSDFRGTVAGCVALLKQAADAIGGDTAAGQAIAKRMADLEANKAQVEEVGVKLNSLLTPPPSLVPSDGLGTPKAPTGPIKDPAPPAGERPQAPAGPVGTPPTGGSTPPTGK